MIFCSVLNRTIARLGNLELLGVELIYSKAICNSALVSNHIFMVLSTNFLHASVCLLYDDCKMVTQHDIHLGHLKKFSNFILVELGPNFTLNRKYFCCETSFCQFTIWLPQVCRNVNLHNLLVLFGKILFPKILPSGNYVIGRCYTYLSQMLLPLYEVVAISLW